MKSKPRIIGLRHKWAAATGNFADLPQSTSGAIHAGVPTRLFISATDMPSLNFEKAKSQSLMWSSRSY
eukprot:COSAG01_NODE_65218_length_274_cov_0.565714_1_plen_67_part_10